MNLYSINYLHFGQPKQWYGIAPRFAPKFERTLENIYASARQNCAEYLRHKVTTRTHAAGAQDQARHRTQLLMRIRAPLLSLVFAGVSGGTEFPQGLAGARHAHSPGARRLHAALAQLLPSRSHTATQLCGLQLRPAAPASLLAHLPLVSGLFLFALGFNYGFNCGECELRHAHVAVQVHAGLRSLPVPQRLRVAAAQRAQGDAATTAVAAQTRESGQGGQQHAPTHRGGCAQLPTSWTRAASGSTCPPTRTNCTRCGLDTSSRRMPKWARRNARRRGAVWRDEAWLDAAWRRRAVQLGGFLFNQDESERRTATPQGPVCACSRPLLLTPSSRVLVCAASLPGTTRWTPERR